VHLPIVSHYSIGHDLGHSSNRRSSLVCSHSHGHGAAYEGDGGGDVPRGDSNCPNLSVHRGSPGCSHLAIVER
jgi:hypothetical protein